MGRRPLIKSSNQFPDGSLNFETLSIGSNMIYNNELMGACFDYLLQKILQSEHGGENKYIIKLGSALCSANGFYRPSILNIFPLFTEERIVLIKLITEKILYKSITIRHFYFMRYLDFINYYNWISKKALIITHAALNLHNFKKNQPKKSLATQVLFNKRFVKHIARNLGM
jgi:hypothetical protein